MISLSDILASFVKSDSKAALRSADQLAIDTYSEVLPVPRSANPQIDQSDCGKVFSGKSPRDQVEITKEFEEAFKLIDSRAPFIFITGRAGTGKSTFTQLLKARLKSFAVVAPTGVAALNVGGQTIHSFFRLPSGPIDFSKIQRVNHRKTYQALRTLIIDEISMVRADLLDAVDQMLRRNASSPEYPFGGVQIIVVGDLFQLPPLFQVKRSGHSLIGSTRHRSFFLPTS